MQGAAITLLQLHDLSYRAGVSTDFKAGIVVDMPWGPIDQTVQGTNKTFEVTHSTVDYGITYSLEWDGTLKANRWRAGSVRLTLRNMELLV